MIHIKYLTNLIKKNEEWILEQILSKAQYFNHTIYSSLINHSWRLTIQDFRQLITQSEDSLFSLAENKTISTIDNNIFQSLAENEAKKCFERGITPQVFLAFLKIIRQILKKLVASSRISSNEKIWSEDFLDKCLDDFEIAFVGSSTELQSENLKVKQLEKRFGIKQFKSLFDNFSLPIMIINPLYKITKHNKAAEKAFPLLFSGKTSNLNGTIRLEKNESLHSKIDTFQISSEKQTTFETRVNYNNKENFYLVNLQKLGVNNEIAALFINLTKWKQLENNLKTAKQKAEDSNRLKTAFLANMSHEIRTPMNAIVGFTELLYMSNPTKSEKDEYLGLIKKSSNDLLNIIEDVIDVAKIESKQLKIHPKNIKLSELVNDLKKIYQDVLYKNEKSDVRISIYIPEGEENIQIHSDSKRLKQVLSNLVNNAIKFTDCGQIEIGYKLSENKNIYFFVKDSGIGIPYKMQHSVFERFVQVEESIEKNTTGTGLGLTISRNIIQLMGGDIFVTSTPKKGTIFYFYLPYFKPVNESKDKKNLEKKELNFSFGNYCVLVAEDDDTNYFYLRESLKSTGLEIIRAKTGLEAINHVENMNKIDLILMDIKMPEVSGIEAASYISYIKPDIPIIALTAFAMDNDKQTCLDAGCSDYISKPLKINVLLDTIKRNLEKSKRISAKHA